MAVAGCVAECLFYKISPIRWRWDISVDPDQQQVREHFPPAEDENLFWEAKKILMVNWTLLLRTAAFLRLRQFTLSGEEILEFLAKENFPYEIEFLGTRDIDLLGNQA